MTAMAVECAWKLCRKEAGYIVRYKDVPGQITMRKFRLNLSSRMRIMILP